ncbi:MAG: hypothetical protein HND52_07355 [Ignavibacteriae bacterium]|nr:hypothetical protein [Ignavibacteriota bacterium]NOG97761.1 hypothetical protein [Ignavibacteriota bacterium]
MNEKLVRQCLFNWLGYGNLHGSIWFIGTEEGGAEIWRQKTKTIQESLEIRKKFKLSMDFINVWEKQYNIPMIKFRGPTVWRYIAAFLLCFEKAKKNELIKVERNDVEEFLYESKKLGRKDSNHFLCELFPLPKKSKNNIEPYSDFWDSIKSYHSELLSQRINLIKEALNENVKVLISYEKILTEYLVEKFHAELEYTWEFKKQKYKSYRIKFEKKLEIALLSTPFFGNGRISYQGVEEAVKKLIENKLLTTI